MTLLEYGDARLSPRAPAMDQLTLDFGPPPPPGFGNFVAGGNAECVAALRRLLAQLDQGAAPEPRFFYIWGPAGSGKSHLAAALAGRLQPRLLVVDDCDRLDADAQQRLFHRFNDLIAQPDQALVAFGNDAPARLGLLPDLVSRLGWGVVFALTPLGDAELMTAFEQAARERGLAIDADVVTHLLNHARRDIASFKGVLDALDRLSLQQKRPVTLQLLRQVLARPGDPLR
ncbi:MAG: DnaA/Hda family protein [Lautropia sp.]